MVKTVVAAELGRLHTRAPAPATNVRHRLLHEPQTDSVVMPYCSLGGAWLCVVVATRTVGPGRPGHLTLTDDRLATCWPRLILDSDDADGLACLLWPTQVFLRWPGGTFAALARVVVDELRIPGTVHVPGDRVADHGRLAGRLPNLRPPAVKVMLDRLYRVALLTADPGGGCRLTIPDLLQPQPATMDVDASQWRKP
jgi:hypothetical protein